MSKVPVRIVAAGETVNLWKIYIGDQEVSHMVRRAELVIDPMERVPILTLQMEVEEVEIPQEALVTLRVDQMMMLWKLADLWRWWIWRIGRKWSKVTARFRKKPKVRLAKKPATPGTYIGRRGSPPPMTGREGNPPIGGKGTVGAPHQEE